MLKDAAILGSMALLVLVAGCQQTIPKEALILTATTLEEREYQSRYFDTTDERMILSASAGVLQDLGFTLEESETELGFLVASKDRDATDAAQVTGAVVMALLFGANVPVDHHQKIRVALIVNPSLDGERTHVRVKIQRKVWNTQNQVSNVETISDVSLYQGFFNRLSKSVFLEAHNI
ncbi:MAG: hypothetical protein KDI88_17830 [Gammaproteobacteria bacterium]|nr:hypothetical protein [Gammaproteobacteria bacterium]